MASFNAHRDLDAEVLEGSSRSSVVQNQQGLRFLIGFDEKKAAPVPERLKGYNSKRKTAEEIGTSQKLAEERKQKHIENKAKMAKKVSDEAIRYDKHVQSRLGLTDKSRQSLGNDTQSGQSKGGKWYSHALK